VALVALVGLVLGLSVVTPSQAAAPTDLTPTARTISGFAAPSTLTAGSAYVARVRVTGGRRVVVLQRRVGGAWRPVARDRSTSTGRAVLRWTAPQRTGRVALRVRALRTPRLPALTSRPQPVRVVAESPVAPVVPDLIPVVPVTVVPVPEVPLLDPVELEVLTLVNEARTTGYTCGDTVMAPVAPVRADARLSRAATGHARSMADHDFFSHTSLDGSSNGDRIKAEGYAFRTAGENIAAGQVTAASVVGDWLESPGHCRNIMNGAFTDLGLGIATNPESFYGTYWAQNLAAPL